MSDITPSPSVLSAAAQAGAFRAWKSLLKTNELDEQATVAKNATVRFEGRREVERTVDFYNLDMILAVGYRVNSHRGTQFRIWATNTLREYLVKGFAIDDERLKGTKPNYFDELLERVRSIRTSEVNFYQKVRDIFAQTSIDYDSSAEPAQEFFATVQNKFHYAISGKTAAELKYERADGSKDAMGLQIWKDGSKFTAQDAQIAKNYLSELDLKRLELLVEQFLSFAEFRLLRSELCT